MEGDFGLRFAELDASLKIIKELQESEDKENTIIKIKERIDHDTHKLKIEQMLDDLFYEFTDSIKTLCKENPILRGQKGGIYNAFEGSRAKILSMIDSYI